MPARVKVTAAAWKKKNVKETSAQYTRLKEKLTIFDELSDEISIIHAIIYNLHHLYIANTHYNDIHYYYNNPNISLIRPPSGPKLFGLVRVYCSTYIDNQQVYPTNSGLTGFVPNSLSKFVSKYISL